MSLVLSLFPGIGLMDMAFEQEGFCVVRGPDLLWGGDVRNFHPPAGRFDGVIGGPPCKRWSRLAHMVVANGYELAPDLIPEFERCVVEAAPSWWLMENVPPAPIPAPAGWRTFGRVLNNRWFGAEQQRERRFTFGTVDGRPFLPEFAAMDSAVWAHAVCAGRAGTAVPVAMVKGGGRKPGAHARMTFARACELQGLPDGFDLPPFTATAKWEAVGNGVPLPMGRAIARAVRRALGLPLLEESA